MPATQNETRAQTLTVLTPGLADAFHTSQWRAIVDAWPAWSDPPPAHITSAEHAAQDDRAWNAVLINAREGIDRPTLRVIDRCRELFVPVVTLCDVHAQGAALEDGPEVMTLDSSTPPAEIACLLAALMKRQGCVCALGREIGAMQRFQRGVRGEIDKMNEELQLAATMQREFLPIEIPEPEGYEIAALFRPCGCVSGDIYDVRTIDEHRVCVLIADAVGHGMPAALMTMVIAKSIGHTISMQSADGGADPAGVLAELNKDLAGRGLDASRFATAVCGVLDTRAHTVTIASAGHPHPLRVRADGRTRRVPCEGCLLGVFEDATYDTCEITLEPGESLVLYSDGFEVAFPAESASERRGAAPNSHYLEHFARIPARTRVGTLGDALAALSAELDAHRGSLHQQDDLTVVGVARAG